MTGGRFFCHLLVSYCPSGFAACFLFRSARLFSIGSRSIFLRPEQSDKIPYEFCPPYSYEFPDLKSEIHTWKNTSTA